MERRQFVRAALTASASAAAGAALSNPAEAASPATLTNVVFSEDDPGHFAAVKALHVPQVEVDAGSLKVTTPHPMSEAHYIVSHTVVLGDGTFVSRKTFSWRDHPVSMHKLPAGYKGQVTVTSTCNLHDWWVKTVTV
ncbi:desulfoferrodoxin [mine drainage metagenome]|jgi:superoxide reductase|uniref:Desulfoferrodoxin n=1 Tax=mine drainage metagenome TaxID=410659 RepID=A0A1J5QY12_9ZZZZ